MVPGETNTGGKIMKDRGPWTLTRNKIKFYLLDPRPEEILFDDIAYSLAHTFRFNGHTDYSNAQHSLRVSKICGSFALEGLMHDAAETYTGDIVRPFQEAMGPEFKAGYKKIESDIMKVIAEKFGFRHPMPLAVKHADNTILRNELMEYESNQLPKMSPDLAQYLFERKSYKLIGERKC
jgi:5'-deoxynucleotidase YfbR-like HD superfamily hydrolase